MDEKYLQVFVTEFIKQLSAHDKAMRSMRSWYVFSDKRPGTLMERFDHDALVYSNLYRSRK